MSILEKVEILKTRENEFVKVESNQYDLSLKTFGEMIQSGITKPRGYCLSSIADYTNIVFMNKNLSSNK